MTISEFVAFVALVCNFDSPKLDREFKEVCSEHYVNCAIVGDKPVRGRLSRCVEEARSLSTPTTFRQKQY